MKTIPSKTYICLNCQKPILQGQRRKFCSTMCNRRFSSKLFNHRHKKLCPICKKRKMIKRAKSCVYCSRREIFCNNLTIESYHIKYPDKHPSWKNAEIRNFARNWNKHLKLLPCQKCGYKHHIELCHIRAISDFPLDTLLSIINNENNLLVLCPNCHWEFDNGILKIEQIPNRKST